MRIPPRITRIGAAGALASALLIGGTAVAAPPAVATAHPATTHASTAYATTAHTTTADTTTAHAATAHSATLRPATVRVTAVGHICYAKLPSQAHDTLKLIEKGGPYPYPQDGTVFDNREGILPDQDSGYYHEYTVETPGSPDRGARRIVTGEKNNEDYYTADHYESFDLIDRSC
ncbi:ribonuclease [Streptomyces piniterrae]|uniref:Ribonuclease n=1 Tax=Streptomyces piniterrae TaxID=2571125 RepID=A0A4U0NJZ9_9ACTN|nr:ribonuclease domain-containing protein [Streptomyces piniterrae]TJZ54616.1 ribonuclease [Streptomyces piniterrae]